MLPNFDSRFDAALSTWRSRTPHLDEYRDRYLNDPTDLQEEGTERTYQDTEPF